MKKVFLTLMVCLSLLVLTSCGAFVSEDHVIKAVGKQGYRNVKIQAKHIFFVSWRGCSKSDDACFDALATNPLGQEVDILICAGWPFKGVTVRTD